MAHAAEQSGSPEAPKEGAKKRRGFGEILLGVPLYLSLKMLREMTSKKQVSEFYSLGAGFLADFFSGPFSGKGEHGGGGGGKSVPA